jgi:hypothetical protein
VTGRGVSHSWPRTRGSRRSASTLKSHIRLSGSINANVEPRSSLTWPLVTGYHIQLLELAKEPKNANIKEAYKVMNMMTDTPADFCSGLGFDCGDKLLVAYFSNHITSVKSPHKFEFFL